MPGAGGGVAAQRGVMQQGPDSDVVGGRVVTGGSGAALTPTQRWGARMAASHGETREEQREHESEDNGADDHARTLAGAAVLTKPQNGESTSAPDRDGAVAVAAAVVEGSGRGAQKRKLLLTWKTAVTIA